MLNKEICKKCRSSYISLIDGKLMNWRWTSVTEDNWNLRGIILCPKCYNSVPISNIPDTCLYYFEQLILEDKS